MFYVLGNDLKLLLHFIRNALRNPKSNYSNRNAFEFQLRFGPTQPLHETRPLNKLNLIKESVSIQTLILHDVPHIRNADSEIFISVIFNMCQNEYYENVESSTEKWRKEKNFQSSFRSESFWHQLTKTNKYPQIKPMNSGFAARYQWIYQFLPSQFLFSSNSTHFSRRFCDFLILIRISVMDDFFFPYFSKLCKYFEMWNVNFSGWKNNMTITILKIYSLLSNTVQLRSQNNWSIYWIPKPIF